MSSGEGITRDIDELMYSQEQAGKRIVGEVRDEAQAALGLLTQDAADAIIDEPGAEYGVLIKGTKAIHAMLWGILQGLGLRKTADTLKAMAQALGMFLTLVHYAYALGIKRGRGDQ